MAKYMRSKYARKRASRRYTAPARYKQIKSNYGGDSIYKKITFTLNVAYDPTGTEVKLTDDLYIDFVTRVNIYDVVKGSAFWTSTVINNGVPQFQRVRVRGVKVEYSPAMQGDSGNCPPLVCSFYPESPNAAGITYLRALDSKMKTLFMPFNTFSTQRKYWPVPDVVNNTGSGGLPSLGTYQDVNTVRTANAGTLPGSLFFDSTSIAAGGGRTRVGVLLITVYAQLQGSSS